MVGTEGPKTVVGTALGRLRAAAAGQFDDKGAALDGVDEDVAGLEEGIAGPGAEELDDAATLKAIILGVNVNPGHLADGLACGVLGDGANIEDTETSTVIGLVDETVDNILVMIDCLDLGLVLSSLLGLLKVADVPNVCNRVPRHGWACSSDLVELVVKYEELLVLRV